MTEHELQNRIRVALSEYGAVFRTNAGKFWQGKLRGNVLTDLRVVEGLPEGFPDLLFIGENGQVAFIEVKTAKGRVQESQKKFISFLRQYGHRAGVARSIEDAVHIVMGKEQKRVDEFTTLDEKLTELNKNLKAIYSLLQRLPEIHAAVFLQMYDDYQSAHFQGLKAKDLWTVAEPQER